jgi:hypothetical protein
VVELEHQGILLAAVDAHVGAEELDQQSRPLRNHRLLANMGLRDVARAVRRVVLPLVLGQAAHAVVVPLASRFAAPGELGDGPGLAAATAAPEGRFIAWGRHANRCSQRPPIPFVGAERGPYEPGPVESDEGHGEWRSLVAHPAGGRAVAGSNPVSPTKKSKYEEMRTRRARASQIAQLQAVSGLAPAKSANRRSVTMGSDARESVAAR